jgi:hypothetical protein
VEVSRLSVGGDWLFGQWESVSTVEGSGGPSTTMFGSVRAAA